MDATKLSDRNADLMDPILELLRASPKEAPTKVGILVDAAAAILATLEPMRNARELRLTSEEMRKRLIQVTRLHQDALNARQAEAAAALNRLKAEGSKQGIAVRTATPP